MTTRRSTLAMQWTHRLAVLAASLGLLIPAGATMARCEDHDDMPCCAGTAMRPAMDCCASSVCAATPSRPAIARASYTAPEPVPALAAAPIALPHAAGPNRTLRAPRAPRERTLVLRI
jgi:hypothetical protein